MNNPHHSANNRFQLSFMTPGDVPEVIQIENKVQSHPWTVGIFRDCIRVGYTCWVCRENHNTIVGYLVQSIAAEEMHILNICVHPDWQRRNLGTLLVQQAEDAGRQGNAKTSYLEVRPGNVAAIRLYQKLGYKKIGIRKNYYPTDNGREDAVVMSRCLVTPC